jgi:glycosyltransferase involved in cell wall biosynthesis
MVADSLRGSDHYDFIYTTVDELDPAALSEGRIAWADQIAKEPFGRVDAVVVNWHIVTMPLSDDLIGRLPGIKMAIVLEAAPGDPLALTPVKSFDAYLVLDPTLPEANKVWAFPRPLSFAPYNRRTTPNEVVRIGSFGFGTPAKGFELVVEAVNREFDRAEIVINIPSGDFISTDQIHDENYVEHLARTLRTIAKPGVNVTVTTNFYSPLELIEWCDANDLNCFMYTREQPGLAATTDQAIICGRPLLTIGNPTFRHITRYLPPYPRQSLRHAIAHSIPAVQTMQKAWSPEAFRAKFEQVLDHKTTAPGGTAPYGDAGATRQQVAVVTLGTGATNDMYAYAARFTAALTRSGEFKPENIHGDDLTDLLADFLARRPEILVVIGEASGRRRFAAIARALLPRSRIVEAGWELGSGDTGVFQLKPIIPFYTFQTPIGQDPAIFMIGFRNDPQGVMRALRALARDDPDARILIDCPAEEISSMRDSIGAAKMNSRALSRLRIDFVDLPKRAIDLIEYFGAHRAVVAQADRSDPADLENKLSLAYVTERPILISPDRPVRFFSDGTGHLGKLNLREVELCGLASRVASVMDYGEWTFVESFRSYLIDQSLVEPESATPSIEAIDAAIFGLLQSDNLPRDPWIAQSGSNQDAEHRALRHLLADLANMLEGDDFLFVVWLYRMILRREPDKGGLAHNVEVLRRTKARSHLVAGFLRSPEYDLTKDRTPYWAMYPKVLLDFPSMPLLIGWLAGLLALTDEDFSAELHRLRGHLESHSVKWEAPSSDRIYAIVELAEVAQSAGPDADFMAVRSRLWSRLCDRIESGEAGIVHDLPALPARDDCAASPSPSSGYAGDLLELAGFVLPRRAMNIFGQPQPSRLFNAVEATTGEIRAVYLLVQSEADTTPYYVNVLAQHWPDRIMTLHRVAWNRNQRRLELVDERQQRVELPAFCDSGCAVLAIAGGVLDDEPMGEIAPISEARRRGWKVAALAEAASVAGRASDDPASERVARFWRALSLVDHIITTSTLASHAIRNFLTVEVGEAHIPSISTVSDLEAERDKAGFAGRIATSLIATAGGPLVSGCVLYRAAANCAGTAWITHLREAGVMVTPWTGDEIPPMHGGPVDDAPRWVLADSVSDRSELARLRSAAAGLGAKTVYLGPVPSGADDLRAELIDWDLVVVTRLADFKSLADWLRRTRHRACDAEARFILLDHPADWLPPSVAGQGRDQERPYVAVPAGLDGKLTVVASDRRPIDVIEVDGEDASWLQKERRVDAFLATGSLDRVGPMVEAAVRAGVPVLIPETADVPDRPGVFPLLVRSGDEAFVVPEASVIAHAAAVLREWIVRTLHDVTRELAVSLARVASPHRSAPKPGAAAAGWERAGRPLLSLCISTYNRGDWLALNLRNIYQQIDAHDQDIEVLVVDNCATDHTRDVCAAFAHQPNFRAVRNEVNVGMLGNLCVTAQHARGDYVWVIGDDDLTREGVIAKVCTILKQDARLDLIYLNYGYTSIDDPASIQNPKDITEHFNILEPDGPDRRGTVAELAAGSENFYTAIYAIVYRREHGFRAYCQDTSGRPFSSLVTCVPTAQYALTEMGRCDSYWLGAPSLVVNSRVSWQAYGPLFDLEQLPRVWDLAEISGADPLAVDNRRANRLWLIEMMWRDMLLADTVGNQAYFDPLRVLMRLKHLPEIDARIPALREVYETAYRQGQPAAKMLPERLFEAWT